MNEIEKLKLASIRMETFANSDECPRERKREVFNNAYNIWYKAHRAEENIRIIAETQLLIDSIEKEIKKTIPKNYQTD